MLRWCREGSARTCLIASDHVGMIPSPGGPQYGGDGTDAGVDNHPAVDYTGYQNINHTIKENIMIIMNRNTIIENRNQAQLGLNISLGEHNDLVNDLIHGGVTEVVNQMNDEGITDPYEVSEGIGAEAFLDMIGVDIDYLYDVNEDVDYSDMHSISYDEETHQDNVESYIQYEITSAIAHAVRTIIENIYGDDPCSMPNDLSWGYQG